MPKKKPETKAEIALKDLKEFILLVHPNRVLGKVHEEVISWWTRDAAKSHQLLLLPRDHQKSTLVAYRVAWEITKNPALRVLYISSTSKLAVKQLKFIKDILLSENYRKHWPEMINEQESTREKWSETEISVDHPLRKQEVIRDPTIFTAGLTTNITGLHCDIAVLDDVVVDQTAYTDIGRNKVKTQVSYLASIASTDSRQWVVGTRYHPKDLYNDMMDITVDIFDDSGIIISSETLYEMFPHTQVESNGDGTGEYLWPAQKRLPDGKWFGFNQQILAKKKAQYTDLTKFRAQYYNNPNDVSTSTIHPSMFQYYSREQLSHNMGRWFIKDRKLNVFSAIDFAVSLNKDADYTAIVVVGVDHHLNYYILDIDRFKTNQISEMFNRILRLYSKWGFRKIRAEITAQQGAIARDLKDNYIRKHGLALVIDEWFSTRMMGTKEERIEAVLQPKYANKQIYHYAGGNCSLLEEELIMQRPAHDDIKDSLSQAIDVSIAPVSMAVHKVNARQSSKKVWHERFGGVAH